VIKRLVTVPGASSAPVSRIVPGRRTASDSWKTKSFIFLFKRLMYVNREGGNSPGAFSQAGFVMHFFIKYRTEFKRFYTLSLSDSVCFQYYRF
jgi:hypothetical protein